jgi:uncharacterized RDD family membrane protein YckC
MSWAENHRIETPEQIDLGLELAGPGSRAVAQIYDWLVKLGFLVLLGFGGFLIAASVGAMSFDAVTTYLLLAILGVLAFLFFIGYDIYYEGCRNGQTPGKNYTGIRVVRSGGGPIDVQAAAIRNIVGLADLLPVGYLVGGILILLNKHAQRFGDMAAGTIVIRERVETAPAEGPETIEKLATTAYSFSREQLTRLTPTDRHVLESYFSRRKGMPRMIRTKLSQSLVETFVTKTGYTPSVSLEDDPETFLASLWRDLSLFQEQRL